MPSSRGSSQPRDQTHVSYIFCTGRWVLYQLHLGSPNTVIACMLCPWDSPGKNTGVDSHSLLLGIFQHRDGTSISCIGKEVLYHFATWEACQFSSDQIRSVAQLCPTLCDPMNRSTPGLPVHHQLPEFTETHVHRVSDAIQPSHPLSSPSPPGVGNFIG